MEVLGIAHNSNEAVVITQKQQVLCATLKAQQQGIKAGIATTTAQLFTPCQSIERDIQREQAAIHQLADALYSYTPYIEKHSPCALRDSGLTIEISRSLQLFKGLNRLKELVNNTLDNHHFFACSSLGHTNKSAWLLSYTTETHDNNPEREHIMARLCTLSIDVLKHCPQHIFTPPKLHSHINALDKSGFNTLGDIMQQIDKQSLASFRKRWGHPFAQLLADIFDIDAGLEQPSLFEQTVEVHQPEEHFYEHLQFDYPIRGSEQLYLPMECLLKNLSEYLTTRQLQCQNIEWLFFDIYHNKYTLSVHSSDSQNQWPLLLELTHIQLQAQSLPFEIDSIELLCQNPSPLEATNQHLNFESPKYEKPHKLSYNFAVTTAKLKARLGDGALFKIQYQDSHIAEQSNTKTPLESPPQPFLDKGPIGTLRPSWLFNAPLPIQEKQQVLYWRGRLHLLQGPERIEGNWWATPTARDYFMAQRDDNLRLWIFYDLLNKQWYVQGVFA